MSHRNYMYTILYSGSRSNRHENSVALLVNDSILPNIKSFTGINGRMCFVHVKGEIWDFTLLNCYSQMEDKNSDVKSVFYEI